jgi:hypothetical protein
MSVTVLGAHQLTELFKPLDIAVSVLLIYLIKKINVLVFFIKNCLSVFFAPRRVIMEFMIEQVVVLGLWNISFFAHDLPKQKLKERTVYADPFPQSMITKQRRAQGKLSDVYQMIVDYGA